MPFPDMATEANRTEYLYTAIDDKPMQDDYLFNLPRLQGTLVFTLHFKLCFVQLAFPTNVAFVEEVLAKLVSVFPVFELTKVDVDVPTAAISCVSDIKKLSQIFFYYFDR